MKNLVESRDRRGPDDTFDSAESSQSVRAGTGKIIDERENSAPILTAPDLRCDFPVAQMPGDINDQQVGLPARLEHEWQFLERTGN